MTDVYYEVYYEKMCNFNEKRSRYYEKIYRFNEKRSRYNDIIEWKKYYLWQQCVTVLDTAVTPSDNFSVLRMDRTAEAGKTKGGGVINNK